MNNSTSSVTVDDSVKETIKRITDEYPSFGTWVSVNDMTPKDKGYYLVSIDPRYMPPDIDELIDIFCWDGEKWTIVDIVGTVFKVVVKDQCPVIAWMPLPKPYLVWDSETHQMVKPF